MMRPTARVLALLELLQAGGTRTVGALADRLAVDERTVRRYVEHLRELDIPVEGVRGRYGGYRLAGHHRMPPLMLTEEEALAVVWALLTEAQAWSGPVSRTAVQSASAKVRRVLPVALGERLDTVLATVTSTTRHHDGDRRDDGSGTQVLLRLTEAARDRWPVEFAYTGRRGACTDRHVQPHGVVVHRGRLYLTGFDVDRQAVRTFRLDRVVGVRRLEGSFDAPSAIDPVEQVLGPLGPSPWRHEVSLLVRADPTHVRAHFPETLASVTPAAPADAAGGWVRIFLRAERLEWVAGRLAVLDRPFLIEDPPALHAAVAALGHRLLAAAAATDPAASPPPHS